MIAADLACAAICRQRKAYGKARRDAERAAIADEDGMEVCAVAAPGVARIIDVAASPALPALVVLHGGDDVIVNGPGFLQVGLCARRIHDLQRPLLDLTVNRHQPVRL